MDQGNTMHPVFPKSGRRQKQQTDSAHSYSLLRPKTGFYVVRFPDPLATGSGAGFQYPKKWEISLLTNYSAIVPPGSYIDANGFSSAKDLAEELKWLSHSREEYLNFFREAINKK